MFRKTYCDAHLHLSRCESLPVFEDETEYFCVSSCHTREDFEFLGRLPSASRPSPGFPGFRYRSIAYGNGFAAPPIPSAFASYGIHPQIVNQSYLEESFPSDLSYLENLLSSKKIVAIGECGFDFFTPGFKKTAKEQEVVFEAQLSLALQFGVPVVLHLRKSIEKIFTYSSALKKLPSVIFHSFPGTLMEARSLLNRGIKAYFSFGKPILNGKKSAVDCVKNLPPENLLLETDSPYQTLKGEGVTKPEEIERVYEEARTLRNEDFSEFCAKIKENFLSAYKL